MSKKKINGKPKAAPVSTQHPAFLAWSVARASVDALDGRLEQFGIGPTQIARLATRSAQMALLAAAGGLGFRIQANPAPFTIKAKPADGKEAKTA